MLRELQQCGKNGERRRDQRASICMAGEGKKRQGKQEECGKIPKTSVCVGPACDGFRQPVHELKIAGLSQRQIDRRHRAAKRQGSGDKLDDAWGGGADVLATPAETRV